MRMWPPDCLAKPYTWLKPSPVPTPAGLVVKNGSNARFITSALMPLPESLTATMTNCPGAISAPVCSM